MVAAVDHMVVGGDIAVLGNNKAAAGGSHHSCLLAEDILGFRRIDADTAVHIGLIQLRIAHQRLAIHRHRVNLHRLAVADVNICLLGWENVAGRIADAKGSAQGHHTS